ncbi:hypothetical protein EGW08_009462 [Elysia chlorotica]|uniref:TGF-beta family profile domain-containing protein n=1 Tax=Elysia chlorotica TaxID=188477 RepID=A0A3S1BFY3_ELYCH|nr:hypothetical protein EGW08_009462 [Elysia chlorotica]
MAKIALLGVIFCMVMLHISLAILDKEGSQKYPPQKLSQKDGSSLYEHVPHSGYSIKSGVSNWGDHSNRARVERDRPLKAVSRFRRSVLSWFTSYFKSESHVTEGTPETQRVFKDIAKQSHGAQRQQISTPSNLNKNSKRVSENLPQRRLELSTGNSNENRSWWQSTTREPRSAVVTEFFKKVNPQTWLTTVSAFLHNGVDIERLNTRTSDLSSAAPPETQTPQYRAPLVEPTEGQRTPRVKRPHKIRHRGHHPEKSRNGSKSAHGDTYKTMNGRALESDAVENREKSHGEIPELCANCGSTDRPGVGTGPKAMSEEEVKVIRTNMIAELLMHKLRLDPREVNTQRYNRSVDMMKLPMLPLAVLDETRERNSLLQEEDDFFARDQEAIVTGHDMGRDCIGMRSTGCYDFRFNGEVKGEVESAELWLYKTHDRRDVSEQTFIVYELERPRGSQLLRRRNLVVREDSLTKEGWVKLNMTRPVRRWLEKRRDGEMLAIRCKTCGTHNYRAIFGTKHGYKPLLIIKYVDKYSMRVKRSEDDCNPATECCKRSLVINFNAIDLPTIFQPANLDIGYCYGYCDGVDRFTYNHTSIKQRVRWTQNVSEQTREQLKPCCVPLQLMDTFILTVENSIIVRKVMPKVIVDRCGCV